MAAKSRDIAALLMSQIASLAHIEIPVSIRRERAWASITFSGTQYCLEVDVTDKNIGRVMRKLVQDLPDHDFDLPGHFVADLLVHEFEPADQTILVDVLVIVDPVLDH